jgi:hypothetical protein
LSTISMSLTSGLPPGAYMTYLAMGLGGFQVSHPTYPRVVRGGISRSQVSYPAIVLRETLSSHLAYPTMPTPSLPCDAPITHPRMHIWVTLRCTGRLPSDAHVAYPAMHISATRECTSGLPCDEERLGKSLLPFSFTYPAMHSGAHLAYPRPLLP